MTFGGQSCRNEVGMDKNLDCIAWRSRVGFDAEKEHWVAFWTWTIIEVREFPTSLVTGAGK
jgi:hypothetical protein